MVYHLAKNDCLTFLSLDFSDLNQDLLKPEYKDKYRQLDDQLTGPNNLYTKIDQPQEGSSLAFQVGKDILSNNLTGNPNDSQIEADFTKIKTILNNRKTGCLNQIDRPHYRQFLIDLYWIALDTDCRVLSSDDDIDYAKALFKGHENEDLYSTILLEFVDVGNRLGDNFSYDDETRSLATVLTKHLSGVPDDIYTVEKDFHLMSYYGNIRSSFCRNEPTAKLQWAEYMDCYKQIFTAVPNQWLF